MYDAAPPVGANADIPLAMALASRSDLSPPRATLDDSRLVLMARAGDQHAFELLVQRHHRRLLARIRRVLPPDRAEDALQNGLLSAWLALQRGTEVRDARPWLERIAHNAALRALRSAAHAELTEEIGGTDDGDPATAFDRRQHLHDALVALASLPDLQRQALLETALEGHSYEEAARSLGVNQSTVRGLVYRARTAMRNALGVLVPLPALGRLLRGRGPTAQPAEAAARAGASVHSGGLGAMVVKGAVALVVAAGGVGVSQVIAGHRIPPTGAHGAPHTLAPLGSRQRMGATTPNADHRNSLSRRRERVRAAVRRNPARRGSGRAAPPPAASAGDNGSVNQTAGGAAASTPTNMPVRRPVSRGSASGLPAATSVPSGASPGSTHTAPSPPPQRGGPAPSTTTGSSQPPTPPPIGPSSGGSSDSRSDPTDTSTTSTDTSGTDTTGTDAATTGAASTSGQSGP